MSGPTLVTLLVFALVGIRQEVLQRAGERAGIVPRHCDVAVGIEVIVEAALRSAQGKVRHVGLSEVGVDDIEAARAIVVTELATYLARQRMAEVTPTVTALRQRAADVIESELLRLDNRLPGLDTLHREEVARTVKRVVDKLLHAPTVRVKQLASAPGGDSYAEALRELFELDPNAVDAVATSRDHAAAEDLARALSAIAADAHATAIGRM